MHTVTATAGLLEYALVGLGLGFGFVGMAGSALGMLKPNPIAPVINIGEHAGHAVIGAGMCCGDS
jgi:hypothetical protein